MELWELMEALGLIITFETKIKELAQSGWKTWKVHELNGLNADIDFSTLSPDLVYCGDKAESYIAKMKEKVLGGSLFSPKEKEAFIDNFFSRNMDILPYKKDIASVLNDFLNRLEKS